MAPRCQLKQLLTLVILVICVYQANAATFTFYDGFEDGAWNDTWSRGVLREFLSCEGLIEVLEERPHSGSKSLYMAENKPVNGVGVVKMFDFNITKVSLWFWWKDLSADNSGLRIEVFDQNEKFIGGIRFLDQYRVNFGVWFFGNDTTLIGRWEPETWNYVEMKFNTESNTVDIYLNGSLLASNLKLKDTGGNRVILNVWVDDSEVYVDTL